MNVFSWRRLAGLSLIAFLAASLLFWPQPQARAAAAGPIDHYLVFSSDSHSVLTIDSPKDQDVVAVPNLDIKGKVRIIAINNTINLMNADRKVTTVIGPLVFNIDQVLNNKQLYKFLNVN